jgi:DNA repair exonuclease SbcCD nuclease subunit
MIKLAFTADTHLGQVQYGLSFRAEDYARMVRDITVSAKQHNCDYIVLGGDIFHSPRPPVSAVEEIKDMVENFQTSHHNVLSIDGNHDNTGGKWLSLCGCVGLGEVPLYCLNSKDGQHHCDISGINGGSTKQILEDLDELISYDALKSSEILVMHLPLTEMTGFPTQLCCKDIAEKLKGSSVKLVLLGDIHDGREAVVDGIRFIYSGSPEITASNENPNKSYLLVTIDKDASGQNTFDIERIPLHPREQVTIRIESEADLKALPKLVPGGDLGPMYHIEFDGNVMNAKERICAIAEKAKAYFRCFPIHTERQIAEGVDRSGFKTSLADIVNEDFEDDEEAKDLLLSILGLPVEDAMEPVKKFLQARGIKV